MNINLEEAKSRVPEEWHPIIDEYAPALIAMTTAEFWAWVKLLLAGDTQMAFRAVVERLDDAAFLSEWDKLNADFAAANERNAAKIALQRRVLEAILQVLLGIALAGVGL